MSPTTTRLAALSATVRKSDAIRETLALPGFLRRSDRAGWTRAELALICRWLQRPTPTPLVEMQCRRKSCEDFFRSSLQPLAQSYGNHGNASVAPIGGKVRSCA